MSESPIRVLQILSDFKKGGVQAEVMYPARLLSKEDVHFDALLLSDTAGYYEDEFKTYGSIYRMSLKRKKTKLQRVLAIFTNYFSVKKYVYNFL